MKQRIFNLIILDESGSMWNIAKQAVDGVNETVQTIRAAQARHGDQEHIVSLVSFNSNGIKTIYDKLEAAKVEDLTPGQYNPSCGTPLYDAMGNAISDLRKFVADNDAVLVTIITDGYENASSEFDAKSIKAMVEALKAKGWGFSYIGANQDVQAAAATISITNTLEFSADPAGTSKMFEREHQARSRWFNRLADKVSPLFTTDDYFAED